MGLAHSIEPSVLYRSRKSFGLELIDIRELTKRLQVARFHLVKYSSDSRMRKLHAYLFERSKALRGRTAQLKKPPRRLKRDFQLPPTLELDDAEAHVKFLNIKGKTQHSARGLFHHPASATANLSDKALHRKAVISSLKEEANRQLMKYLYVRQYEMQTNWLSLVDKVISDNFNWQSILYGYSSRLLKFVINLRANTLPSPDNLRRWKTKGNLFCGLCNKANATSAHILNGCPWVRDRNKTAFEDRYTWRHNGVLCIIINALIPELIIFNNAPPQGEQKPIKFVAPGYKKKSPSRKLSGLLRLAQDWKVCCDLPEFVGIGNSFVMPHDVIVSDLKVDLLLISKNSKIVIFIELTCPNDENLEYWNKEKFDKYSELLLNVNPGWTAHLFTLEIGSRGFVLAKSFYNFTNRLGFSGKSSNKLRKLVSSQSLRCSYVIWINRFNKNMDKRRITACKIPNDLLYTSQYKNSRSGTTSSHLNFSPPPNITKKYSFPPDAVNTNPSPTKKACFSPRKTFIMSDMKQELSFLGKLSNYSKKKMTPPKQQGIPSSFSLESSRLKCLPPIVKSKQVLSDISSHPSVNSPIHHPKTYPKLYFPHASLRACRYRISRGYHIGKVTVTCEINNKEINLQCYDHGQYPWGRSRSKGAMAKICKVLEIYSSSGAANTCLATHIIIGLIATKLFTPDNLVTKFGNFLKNLLSSDYMRDDGPTIKTIFRKMNLYKKICLRRVPYIPTKGFVLINDMFGDINKPSIFLMHKNNHFFLGLQQNK